MAQSNIDGQLAQDPPGAQHAGVDLALEKNVLDNRRLVRSMKKYRLKGEIAQPMLSDFGCEDHAKA